MTRQTWDEDDEEWNTDDETFDGEATISCPHCGNEVYEDSPRCPSCENYLSQEDSPTDTTQKPWWILFGTGLGLLAFLRWLFV